MIERFSTAAEDVLLLQAGDTAFSAHLAHRAGAAPLTVAANICRAS